MKHLPTDTNFFEAVKEINRERDPDTQANWTLDRLGGDSDKTRLISLRLEKEGLCVVPAKRLGGNMALVIALPHHRVLRVADAKIEKKRPRDWEIWQPTFDVGTVAGFHAEVFPIATPLSDALKSGEVAPQEAAQLIRQAIANFAKKGEFLWDCKPENFCVVKTGEHSHALFVLDAGALTPLSQMHEGRIGRDTNTNLDKFSYIMTGLMEQLGEPDASICSNPEAYLRKLVAETQLVPIDYEAVQRAYTASLGLGYGQIQPPKTSVGIVG